MNGRALALVLALLLLVSGLATARRLSEPRVRRSASAHAAPARSSTTDEALRRAVARAIYGHPAFWRYAALPVAPIHITVEDGHVTLTGVVDGEIERALARSLASGHGEVSVISLLRTRPPGVN